MNKKKIISAALTAALIAIIAAVGYLNSKNVIPAGVGEGVMRAVFFDVGYNDCALFYTKDASILIGAPDGKCESIVGYMKRCGIKTLDCLIIPDYKYDSCGGTDLITDNFTVKTILLPLPYDGGKTNYLTIQSKNKTRSETPDIYEGQTYNAGDMTIEVLSPTGYPSSAKDGGAVVRISYAHKSVLWCANIDSAQEKNVIYYSSDKVMCDIIKIPSHGSKNSCSGGLLDLANADYAVISCGKNSYGHPSEEVMERLTEREMTVVITQSNGTAVFDISAENIEKIK